MKEGIILLIAVFLDFILGDPYSWPHPVIFIGKLIKKVENYLRKQKLVSLKVAGFILVGITILMVNVIISLIINGANIIHPYIKDIITIYFIYTALAARCLGDEGIKVYRVLKERDIEKSRKLLSYLVGRETEQLSEKEVIRGTVETVAENTVDGVLAPLFYLFLGFLAGIPVQAIYMYKAINTLDSMVGYTNNTYKEIGFASAKLDDIVNYIPARLGAILMLISGVILRYDGKQGFKILKRDRRNHKSPNCGYPEAIVAGLLGVQLGGTNTYFGEIVYKPTLGDSINILESKNIIDAIKIMYVSEILMIIISFMILNYR